MRHTDVCDLRDIRSIGRYHCYTINDLLYLVRLNLSIVFML